MSRVDITCRRDFERDGGAWETIHRIIISAARQLEKRSASACSARLKSISNEDYQDGNLEMS